MKAMKSFRLCYLLGFWTSSRDIISLKTGIIEHFIPEGMRMKKLFCLTLSILDSQAAIQRHIKVTLDYGFPNPECNTKMEFLSLIPFNAQ